MLAQFFFSDKSRISLDMTRYFTKHTNDVRNTTGGLVEVDNDFSSTEVCDQISANQLKEMVIFPAYLK